MSTIKLLSAADLKSRFKKMIPFMSTEETRYYLQGVYFEYENGNLKATATNGHILCTMEWQSAAEQEENIAPFSVICPANAVKSLVKIITAKEDKDGGVLMTVTNDSIEFNFTDFKYKTHTVDGTYPDYTKTIPSGKVSLKKGLNARYLKSVLVALGNSPVDIEVDDAANATSQPHLFSSADVDGVRCVIMPMRV